MTDPPLPSAGHRTSAQSAAARARPDPPPASVRRLPLIPDRYAIRDRDKGRRTLECDEAPRLLVYLDPEMSASKSDAGSLGERTILLDGAGSFGPTLDNDRKLYNLDHHSGCERLFTLATCEQALMLVHSGLDLSEGDWKIYANDPDLDTVLALWCLLNHKRLRELRPEARDVLLPVLRLEGAIDANGPELARWCGLPQAVMDQANARIDQLLQRERALKQTGSWAIKDVYTYTQEMLRAIDAMVYVHEDFGDYSRVEEIYGHVEIAPRCVAVVCRDRSGIYTVEQHLKTRWGDQLGVIALENQPGVYTLRRVNSLGGPSLQPAYDKLNRIDPAVDGCPPGKRWGGSEDIGGSPRPRGTQLASAELIEVLERAYRKPNLGRRVGRVAVALATGLLFLVFWPLGEAIASLGAIAALPAGFAGAFELAMTALLALAVGTVATRAAARWRPWVFGWRQPAPGRFWWLAPLVIGCALPVRGWAPTPLGDEAATIAAGLAAAALLVGSVEVWFRGLVHGILSLDAPIQQPGGNWFVSRAALVSALTYAGTASAFCLPALSRAPFPSLGLGLIELLGVVFCAAFVAGLALAAIRERSLSIAPGVILQLLGIAVSVAAWTWLA